VNAARQERCWFNSDLDARTRDSREIHFASKPRDEVQSDLWNPRNKPITERVIEWFDKQISPFQIHSPHWQQS
jgi:hypothetical protein